MKRLLPLVLLVCLVVGCGSSKACPHGAEIVLHAVPQHGQVVTPAGMEVARNILSDRVSTIGVGSPSVTIRGNDEIVIAYAGTHVPQRFAGALADVGQLQVFDFEKDLAPPTVKNGTPTPYPSLYSLLTAVKSEAGKGTPAAYYLASPSRVLQGPAAGRSDLLVRYGGKQSAGTTILAVPEGHEVVSGRASGQPVKTSPSGAYWYLFTLPPELGSADLNESNIEAGVDSFGTPQVQLGFNRHGAREFRAITRAEYERGQLVAGLHGSAGRFNDAYAGHSAIVLDNKLEATPSIDYTDASLSLGIAGGGAVINNMESMQAAKNLALVLQSGSLPYRFVQVSARAVCAR